MSGEAFGACFCDSDAGLDASIDSAVSDGAVLDSDVVDATPDVRVDAGIAEELKAFPGAFGAGAVITGGRGGQVIPVTRLDDAFDGDGQPMEGTLRFALTRPVPRTVVFRVSGSIIIGDTDGDGVVDSDARFPTMLYVSGEELSDLTVAGQTAPEGGITIVGYLYGGGASNMIWRYIRVRKPSSSGEFGFSAVNFDGSDDVVFDHLSVAYGSNESLNLGPRQAEGLSRSSVQYNLIGLGNASTILGRITDGDTDQSVSFHHNFLSQLTHRTPNVAGNADAEVINNLVYNWAFRLVNVHNGARVNHIANAYVAGPWTPSSDLLRVANKIHTGTEGVLDARIYTAGNFITDVLTDPSADNWPSWRIFVTAGGFAQNDPAPAALQADSMFPLLGVPVTIRTAEDVRMHLPDEVGAFRTLDENGRVVTFRDSLDTGYIDDYRNGTGATSAIDPDTFVYPDLPDNAPYADGDGDGMPDAWEMANGFDPETDDSAEDADDDGYTNLEEFLNLVDID